MEKVSQKPSRLKPKLQKAKSKLAASYYGNPAEDLKIIAITGSTGKSTVANFIHQILLAAGLPSALILSPLENPLSPASLQKQLKSAATNKIPHVILETPANLLQDHVFYNLPIHMAVITDILPNQPGYINDDTYKTAKSTIFRDLPHFSVLNRDDSSFDYLSTFPTKTTTTNYGRNKASTTRINRSKLYKKGTEANLTVNDINFDIATFIPGEESVSHMAAAVTAALLLGIPTDTIVEGIASYEPDNHQ